MKDQSAENDRVVVPPRGGLMHVVDAAGYSLAGFRRLMRETAARLELLGAAALIAAFLWRGAAPWHWAGLVLLMVLVLVVETLNTAIEVLTDRISPEWSEMARDAKDLGSLAVGLMLTATGAYAALVLARLI